MNPICSSFLQGLICAFLVIPFGVKAQSVINGTIRDEKGAPIAYASIFIKGSTDGTISDTTGRFTIKTKLQGNQFILVSYIGYEQISYPITLEDKEYSLSFKLKEAINKLDDIVISAGTIEANNERKVAVLRPLDIVTIAGAAADVISAIQTLPGVQRNGGDKTGLLVRGGDASESMVLIDGVIAQNVFYNDVPGISQRSRFNPFQFKGTSFSSGGYSARFGQALSSVLDLQSNDLPQESTVNIGLNLTGISISGSKLMNNNAVEYTGSYLNLSPYLAGNKTNFKYYKNPQGGSFSTRWISKVSEKGLFKMDFYESYAERGITIPDPENYTLKMDYSDRNENTFFITSYSHLASDRLRYFTAFSFSNNINSINWGDIPLYRHDSRVQGRGEINYQLGSRLYLITGTEIQRIGYDQVFNDTNSNRYSETQVAGYLETEWKPERWFGLKTGVRAEYSEIIAKGNIVPRVSLALKTGENSQLSAACGIFYQLAPSSYLIKGYQPDFQQAVHYILNYQRIKNDRTFRIEAYYKSYDQLIRENNVVYDPNPYRYYLGVVDNSGSGYAQGFDLFWRDKKSIKGFEYWISYSYIDTKRLYQNYPSKATPDFISSNNLNVITKYFIDKIQTNISLSYCYASGRSYYNPNATVFLADKAPDYHNASLSISYLTSIKKMFTVIYFSIDNITNQHNILGYRYSNDGLERYAVVPASYLTLFFGINISLTKFNKDEL